MGNIFHVEIEDGIYLISSDAFGKSMEFGKPTANSYLVVGDEKALLFDLAVNEPGVKAYVKKLTDKPLMLVLSHGHPDHIYHINDFTDVWMHEADKDFPMYQLLGPFYIKRKLCKHFLKENDVIELGNRQLDVAHIPGHTMGSILLFDKRTGTLLSGDTIARRLLYGTCGYVAVDEFCENISKLRNLPIRKIYSAHDRAAIALEYIGEMVRLIKEDLPHATKDWSFPGLGKMKNLVCGEEDTKDFFDIAIPLKCLK
ncbi:MAG: MBL fold metallo-hydrolase [Agathobacter sp.]|nr:MBL fold metallo-hydrolase [Agathobacter sp.]